MATRKERKFSFENVLNVYLSESEVFSKLFEAVSTVSNDLIQEKITQLARIRDPRVVHRGDYVDTPEGRGVVTYVKRTEDPILDEVHVDVPQVGSVVLNMRSLQDRNILINNTRMMGFNYFSDTLSDDDYARIHQFVGEYWPLSSGGNFVNFMGYVNRIYLEMTPLWSEDLGEGDDALDYYNELLAFDTSYHTPVWEGGVHFPTSHVELAYDAFSVPSPQEKIANIVSLFYYLAPIHLVLERIVANLATELKYTVAGAPDLFVSNSSQISLDYLMGLSLSTDFSQENNSQFLPLIF